MKPKRTEFEARLEETLMPVASAILAAFLTVGILGGGLALANFIGPVILFWGFLIGFFIIAIVLTLDEIIKRREK